MDGFAISEQRCFPVVNEDQKLIGVADASDLRRTIREAGFVDQLIIAKELAVNPPTLTRQEDLYSAVHKMVASRHDELVVVDEDDPQKVAGILSRSDLVAAYDRQFLVRDIP
ncbi:MAG: CBS domain-containing protein [Candidatus Hydrogenedentota bacterium]|nr:MAG: CBS domain-containing protein [Candidatus Hydrogenedentota bacterium]